MTLYWPVSSTIFNTTNSSSRFLQFFAETFISIIANAAHLFFVKQHHFICSVSLQRQRFVTSNLKLCPTLVPISS